jgi:hypothetical protein
MQYLLAIVIFVAPLICQAQNFTFSWTFSQFSSYANEAVAYDDIPIQNQTNQNLNLRWVMINNDAPAAWEVRIQDPDSFYADGTDTGYFLLDTIASFNDLMACYFFPNGVPYTTTIALEVSRVDDSTQSAIISWEYFARPFGTSIEDPFPTVQRSIIRRGSFLEVHSEQAGDKFHLFDLNGACLQQVTFNGSSPASFQVSTNQVLIYKWQTKDGDLSDGEKLYIR